MKSKPLKVTKVHEKYDGRPYQKKIDAGEYLPK